MTDPWAATRGAYDTVAENYAELVRMDQVEASLDLAMLDEFSRRVRGKGRVLDAGCGPGRVTRYLSDRGVHAFGIDLSPQMVRVATDLHPGLEFSVGSLDALEVESGSLAGVLAWYSIIHTRPADLPTVLGQLLRVLEPGGWLLTGHQSGDGDRHLDHAYGHDIDLTAYLYTAEHMSVAIEALGGVVHARLTRGPERSEKRPQAFVLARSHSDVTAETGCADGRERG